MRKVFLIIRSHFIFFIARGLQTPRYEKIILISCILFAIHLSKIFAQNYEHPNLKELKNQHQKIAILPFLVKLESQYDNASTLAAETPDNPKFLMQTNCYYMFSENKINYTTDVLDLKTTNEIVKKVGFVFADSTTEFSFKKIADSLKVDAVLVGAVTSYDDEFKGGRYNNTKMSRYNVDVIFYLFEGKTGQKLWQRALNSIYDLKLKNHDSTIEQIYELLAQKSMAVLPYHISEKKKKK